MRTINRSLHVGVGNTTMLKRSIVTGALGLGLFAAMIVPSAAELTQADKDFITNAIERLRVVQQNQINLLSARVTNIEKNLLRNPPPTPASTAPPARVIHIHRHYYRYWCPPPWWVEY